MYTEDKTTMRLWNKQLESKAKKYPLYSQEGKGLDSIVLVKYFNPYGAGTWLITEAERLAIFWVLPLNRMGMGICYAFGTYATDC